MLAPPPGACFTTHRNHELRARASQLRAWLGRAAKVPANVPVVLVNVSADDELEQKLGELQRQQNVRLSPGTLSQKGGFLEAGFDFDGFLRAPKAEPSIGPESWVRYVRMNWFIVHSTQSN